MTDRWSIEQVEAIAPSAAAMSAARPLATIGRWHGLGADERAVWGSFHGNGAEPYDTMVDHATVGFSCSCPSRRIPCKHTLALLILWIDGHVVEAAPPAAVVGWMARRRPVAAPTASSTHAASRRRRPRRRGRAGSRDSNGSDRSDSVTEPCQRRPRPATHRDLPTPLPSSPDHPPDHPSGRDDRVARMYDGLNELDRWLVDRMRTGLADPSLARFETWDALASRLVDARAGSLANRVRRLSGVVGASRDWHERVLDEIGLLHLLSQAGRRLATLPDPLADRVATTIGWQVRQHDVLAGVPDTDDWIVAGRSDTREDRIEVRRYWLRGATTNRWALVLSFAAYRQSLDTSLAVGSSFRADLHRYPGPGAAGAHRRPVRRTRSARARTRPRSVVDACAEIGAMLAVEPWLDRVPTVVRAAPTRSGGRWALTDDTGTLLLREASPRRQRRSGSRRPAGRVRRRPGRSHGRVDAERRRAADDPPPAIRPDVDRHRTPSRAVVRGCGMTSSSHSRSTTTGSSSSPSPCSAPIAAIRPTSADRSADLVADAVRASPAERMLAEVAAVTAVRRAGFMPLDPVATLGRRRHDDRPVCSAAAADRWHHVVASWPVLEDEWMLTLIERGWRVDPRIVPAMLRRHRRDPSGGRERSSPPGRSPSWLVDLLPELDLAGNRRTVERQYLRGVDR